MIIELARFRRARRQAPPPAPPAPPAAPCATRAAAARLEAQLEAVARFRRWLDDCAQAEIRLGELPHAALLLRAGREADRLLAALERLRFPGAP